ncbi:hypothetical protein [Bdellovibrio sp. NC01]|uniref:hypothetical protein n=1 Tax=Bdellovibrio sp. NC01 TaxID=2220073 RepID=UPI0011574EA9|nr:hypothetical protein [Bdellovibrio sp. NC01]QDK38248.1 hypothetical protein DOE51_11985 [Bdellovibrio sp. NC01]
MKFWVLFILLLPQALWANATDDEVVIPLEDKNPPPLVIKDSKSRARIEAIVDSKTIRAVSYNSDWFPGEVIFVDSQSKNVGIIAFVEVKDVLGRGDGSYELRCELLRQSRAEMIQVGDQLMHIDMTTDNARYKGSTDLMIRRRSPLVSAKYKPLITQGLSVGDTAETLWENEYLITWYGQLDYGWKDWLTVQAVLPGYLLGAYNATAKFRAYQSNSTVISVGPTFARIPSQDKSTLNLNFYWDSISSESTLSHTFATLALFSFENAEDATAIKSLGTSSFQTGYEFILGNWDRVLLGPTYNFEKKAIGGYLTYLKIWDHFHGGLSVNSTNISSFKLSPVDGYYFTVDAYWRF